MRVFFKTSTSPKKRKGYYKDLDFDMLIGPLSELVTIIDDKHYIKQGFFEEERIELLTAKMMLTYVERHLFSLRLEDYDLIHRKQKIKVSNEIFKILRNEE